MAKVSDFQLQHQSFKQYSGLIFFRMDGWMASPTQWTGACISSGSGDGGVRLVCSSQWGHKMSDTTEWLNWAELNWDERNCVLVWTFFWIAFLWDWNENWSWQPLCKWPGFPFFVQRKMWWGYFCLFMSLVSVKYSNLNQQPAYPLEKWLILAAMSLACPFPKNPLKLHHE